MRPSLTIKTKLYLLTAMIIFLSGLLISFIVFSTGKVEAIALNEIEGIVMAAQEQKLKTATHAVAMALESRIKGLRAEDEQIQSIRSAINDTRFETDASGYFFVYRGTQNVVHPPQPNLQGKDLGGIKDPNGVYPIRELKTQAGKGGGFCIYHWKKPGKGLTPKLGYAEMIPGTDFWIGTGVYLDNIDTYKAATHDLIDRKVTTLLIWIMGITVIVFTTLLIAAIATTRSITVSIRTMTGLSRQVLAGDFTHRIRSASRDEMGQLSTAFNDFTRKMDTIMGDIKNQSQTMNALSLNLTGISGLMQSDAGLTERQAGNTADEAGKMSRYMEEISELTGSALDNTRQVASATEEMTATIKEISLNTDHADTIAKKAEDVSKTAGERIRELGDFARKIQQVTDSIQDISKQTNLLALNATIEASRAGEAGKGFAVVAGEIKALADQTANATVEIREKIQGIQARSDRAIEDIGLVEEHVVKASESMALIKTAVKEQALATDEIRDRILDTSNGMDSVNQSLTRASDTARSIAGDMAVVHGTSRDMAENSSIVSRSADELNQVCEFLSRMCGEFATSDNRFFAGPVKSAHSVWKKRMADLLCGNIALTPDQVVDHHDCDFGKWYFGKGGKAYGHMPTFRGIDDRHKKVHSMAREITEMVHLGEQAAARELNREFLRVTDGLFEELDLLEQETAGDHQLQTPL